MGSQVSVVTENTGDAGNGLIAIKDIKVGELIVKDSAVIAIPANVDVWESGEEIVRQLKKLSYAEKEEFYNLTRKEGICQLFEDILDNPGIDAKIHSKAEKNAKFSDEISIFFNNAIITDDSFRCFFLFLSLLNHSCDPNSFVTGTVTNPHQLELRAARDILEGEEVRMNYILVEGRFSDRPTRRAKLWKGWDFYCSCSLCQGENLDIEQQKQEILKQEILIIQADMRTECDQTPETVNWTKLCSLQSKVVELVTQISHGQLLLTRELRSLAHFAQLARMVDVLEMALSSWYGIIQELRVQRWDREYNFLIQKLKRWENKIKTNETPNEEEIRQFLWLM